MARILIAASPEAADAMGRILGSRHEPSFVRTIREARASLQQPGFELIMIDVHFDESRMFELLTELQRKAEGAREPVICLEFPRFSGHGSPNKRTS